MMRRKIVAWVKDNADMLENIALIAICALVFWYKWDVIFPEGL